MLLRSELWLLLQLLFPSIWIGPWRLLYFLCIITKYDMLQTSFKSFLIVYNVYFWVVWPNKIVFCILLSWVCIYVFFLLLYEYISITFGTVVAPLFYFVISCARVIIFLKKLWHHEKVTRQKHNCLKKTIINNVASFRFRPLLHGIILHYIFP